MPITPLHLGILAPINHFFPKKVSNVSFIWVTLWMDLSAIAYYALGLTYDEFHSPSSHSFVAATGIAGVVLGIGILISVMKMSYHGRIEDELEKLPAWCWGAYLGALSHILLDAMVHSEMLPFHPLPGNPFYWGGMEAVSLALVPPFVWLISQYASCTVSRIREIQAAWRLRNY